MKKIIALAATTVVAFSSFLLFNSTSHAAVPSGYTEVGTVTFVKDKGKVDSVV
ncbi:hypothetical protein [Paenibacillus yonginensis]|jgi:hypothetical protein|uniref:hypothetical protein n=1 Tax=Paenibacillus yonginensis TaxID=1462996 RepID=UPI00147249E6|nr:hypothetical protein [Paenibacillus yonginensis]